MLTSKLKKLAIVTISAITMSHGYASENSGNNTDSILQLNQALLLDKDNKNSDLKEESYSALTKRLTNPTTKKLDRTLIYDNPDWSDIADLGWFDQGYKIDDVKLHQDAIEILKPFKKLPKNILDANLDIVTEISQKASSEAKRHALYDAEGEEYLYYLAESMGSALGEAFIRAYDLGELKKATAVLRKTDIQVDKAKKFFGYPRPFSVSGNRVSQIKDDILFKDGKLYSSSPDNSFPSGHTYSGNTAALLMANMMPERFASLIIRGADYGLSRVILGVHYPLDVIGARMVTQHDVANLLADDKYRKLFNEAKQELRTAVAKECNTDSIEKCIAKNDSSQDKYNTKQATELFMYTLNYGLPKVSEDKVPFKVPANAIFLLKAALPKLSDEQLNQILTETALPYGDVFSTSKYGDWQRIDLLKAYQKGTEL